MFNMELIQTICSVASLVVALFIVNKVYKIDQKINQIGNKNKSINQNAKGNGNQMIGKQ
ncbi:hypothetical protein SCN93_05720 [Legionella pneumophila serogroup 1]